MAATSFSLEYPECSTARHLLTTILSQRIAKPLVQLPAPVIFILSQYDVAVVGMQSSIALSK
jgi:hypothetical protein